MNELNCIFVPTVKATNGINTVASRKNLLSWLQKQKQKQEQKQKLKELLNSVGLFLLSNVKLGSPTVLGRAFFNSKL